MNISTHLHLDVKACSGLMAIILLLSGCIHYRVGGTELPVAMAGKTTAVGKAVPKVGDLVFLSGKAWIGISAEGEVWKTVDGGKTW